MDKKYIYNPAQANFYMSKGVFCLGTGIHKRTGNVFYIFGYNDSKKAYSEWCDRGQNKKI